MRLDLTILSFHAQLYNIHSILRRHETVRVQAGVIHSLSQK